MRRIWTRIKNFFYWGWKLNDNYDWDYVFLLNMIQLKLQRMYKYHKNYGHTLTVEDDPNDPDADKYLYKSLRISDALCTRLIERSSTAYAIYAQRKFDLKWGGVEIIEKDAGSGMSSVTFRRKNVNINNQGQYEKDRKKLAELSLNMYNRDKRLLFSIMEKYLEYWWD